MTERTAVSMTSWSPPLASLAVFLGAVAVFGLGLGWLGLIEPDEARYAAVAREMLERGDLVTPRFNGFVYLDKPPALHWLTALSFAVLGPGEFAARLFPMLAAAGTVALVYAFGRQAFGHQAGLCSALILASSIMWFAVGRVVRFDALLALAIAATVWWAWRGTEGGPASRRDYILASIVAAFGVLVKGPVAVALPLVIIVVYLAVTRRLRALMDVPWPLCIAVFVAIAVPWFVLCERANPGAVRFFLFQENIARAAGKTDATHWEPWWYFLVIMAVGSAPWTLVAAPAIFQAGKPSTHANEPQRRASVLVVVWLTVVLVLFSLPKVKLPPYILPAMPALAVILGRYVSGTGRARVTTLLTGALLIVGGVALYAFGYEPTAAAGVPPMPILALATGLLVLGGAGALAFGAWRRPFGAAASIAASALLLYHCVEWGATQLAKPPSDRAAVAALAHYRGPGQQVVCYRELSRGAVFYLNTGVILMGNPPGEYDFPPNKPQLAQRVRPVEQTKEFFAESPPMVGLSRLRNWDHLIEHAGEHVEELERIGKHFLFRRVPSQLDDSEGEATGTSKAAHNGQGADG